MIPIPKHLRRFEWYAPHLAWLRKQGWRLRHDPGDAKPERAVLKGEDLSGENLQDADLRYLVLCGANLWGTNVQGGNLGGAILREAHMREADLQNAILWEAGMYSANLHKANMRGTNLQWTGLEGANLTDALGIVSFGPAPGSGCIGYAVLHENCVMVKLDYWWDTLETTIAWLRSKGQSDHYIAMVQTAAQCVEAQC